MKQLKTLLFITLGSAITAFGIINFAVNNQLADGGFTGITLILFHVFGISTATSNLLLNIPMLIIGYRQFSKRTFALTIFGTLMLSVFLRLFEVMDFIVPSLQHDMILAAIGYGVCVGAGMGIIFREGGTTGGADIIAKLLKDKVDIPIAHTLFTFDTGVICLSLFMFLSFPNAIYTLVGLYLTSRLILKIQEGFQSGYQVLIISKHPEQIADLIHTFLNRGATFLKGSGSYKKEEKQIIVTIITKKQLVRLKKIIYQVDPHAFISVSHVYETLGEGFTFEEVNAEA